VLLNVAMITAALALAPRLQQPVMALAWGVLAAGVLQLGFHLPSMARLGLLPRPRWGAAHEGVKRVMRLMVPTLFGSSVAQLNLLLNTVVASMLIGGSVTWLYLGDRLLEFPLGMFGVAIGAVILPHLSSRHAVADPDGYSKALDWGFRLCLMIAVPACLGLMLCSEALVATLFQHGRFTAHDTQMARLTVLALSTALPAFLLVKVLAPAFYSRQDTRTPVKAGVVAVVANVAATVLFLAALLSLTEIGRTAWSAGGGDVRAALKVLPGAHACLALATAVAGWTNALQLWWYLRRARVFRGEPGWGRFLRQLALASVAMAVAVAAL